MGTLTQIKTKASPSPLVLFTSALTGLLQRTCGSSCVTGLAAEHDDAHAMRLAFQRRLLGHDFGKVRIHEDVSRSLQPKLAISQPGDWYEREADRVADQVMRMSQ